MFRPGQLLGIAVVRVLVEELGSQQLKAVDRDIFAICSTPQWIRFAGGCIDWPVRRDREVCGQAGRWRTLSPAIVLPLKSVVASLREALLEVTPEEAQRSFVFHPSM